MVNQFVEAAATNPDGIAIMGQPGEERERDVSDMLNETECQDLLTKFGQQIWKLSF
jgi:hypothetical protein